MVMRVTTRERLMAAFNGEEPDKTPVCIHQQMLAQYPGGWYRRLKERGLGLIRPAGFYRPVWALTAARHNPHLPDVTYKRVDYSEKGVWKCRLSYDTPVGSISSVWMANPVAHVTTIETPEQYFIKQPQDWRVVNYIIKGIIDRMGPSYKSFLRAEDEIGEDGVCILFLGYTAWQRAWIEIAGPERAVIDFHKQIEEVQEFIDLHRQWHSRIAEFAAESPAKFIDIGENISDMISPAYFREYCKSIYEVYAKKIEGTGKILGVHMDGRLGHLRKEIAETPINVIESYSVPPTGDVSLTEAKEIWPDKMLFMNTASHLAWAGPGEVREFYEALAGEWGSKKGILLELVEQLPPDKVELHMSAALDAFGY
jgi:hypothetical protein